MSNAGPGNTSPLIAVRKAGNGTLSPIFAGDPTRPLVGIAGTFIAGENSDEQLPAAEGMLLAPDVVVGPEHGIEYALSNPARSLAIAMRVPALPPHGTIFYSVDSFIPQFVALLSVAQQALDSHQGRADGKDTRIHARQALGDLFEWAQYVALQRAGNDSRAPLRVPERVCKTALALSRAGAELRHHQREFMLAQAGLSTTASPSSAPRPSAETLPDEVNVRAAPPARRGSKAVEITRVVGGRVIDRAIIRGASQVNIFTAVRQLAARPGSTSVQGWEDIEGELVRLPDWNNRLLKLDSIKRYAREIRDTVTEQGLGSLWKVYPDHGVTWTGPRIEREPSAGED